MNKTSVAGVLALILSGCLTVGFAQGKGDGHPGHQEAPPNNTPTNHGHGWPGCGVYYRVAFAVHYDELIQVFRFLKDRGMPEDKARALADDGGALAAALYGTEFGDEAGFLAALVYAGAGQCAVDSAY